MDIARCCCGLRSCLQYDSNDSDRQSPIGLNTGGPGGDGGGGGGDGGAGGDGDGGGGGGSGDDHQSPNNNQDYYE